MGRCGECIHMNTVLKRESLFSLSEKYYCELLKRFVREGGSCESFEEKPQYHGSITTSLGKLFRRNK